MIAKETMDSAACPKQISDTFSVPVSTILGHVYATRNLHWSYLASNFYKTRLWCKASTCSEEILLGIWVIWKKKNEKRIKSQRLNNRIHRPNFAYIKNSNACVYLRFSEDYELQ